ncbi:MAG: hypothetical protein HQM08_00595 [Candidatus Riflebacteria bacterium]|nr:hypothetical protein [Candidatus Riflebacteria bacterium]
MSASEIVTREEGTEIIIIGVQGYFDDVCGKNVRTALETYLRKGVVKIILDVGGAKNINSLGVASVLKMVLLVLDNYKGRFLITGLNSLKKSVFELTGVIPLAEVVETVDDGIKQLKAG